MNHPYLWRGLWVGFVATLGLLMVPRAEPQIVIRYKSQPRQGEMIRPPLDPRQVGQSYSKVTPKLEVVAETKLLMNGLLHTNFRGLERLLTEQPKEVTAWQFARGQALLIAESANLLMLRPPKNQGQPIWFDRSMALRDTAKELAKAVGTRDYEGGKAGLLKVAATCNSCHQAFRVPAEITPFQKPKVEKVKADL